jgi:hypothetical protein
MTGISNKVDYQNKHEVVLTSDESVDSDSDSTSESEINSDHSNYNYDKSNKIISDGESDYEIEIKYDRY